MGAGAAKRDKKKKKPKKEFGKTRKLKEGEELEDIGPAATGGGSSTSDVVYSIKELQDPGFWQAKKAEFGNERWKWAPVRTRRPSPLCTARLYRCVC